MLATHPVGYLRVLISIAALGLLAALLLLPAPVRAQDAETIVPTLVTANVDGTSLKLIYSEALKTDSVPAASAYTVAVDGATGVAPSGRRCERGQGHTDAFDCGGQRRQGDGGLHGAVDGQQAAGPGRQRRSGADRLCSDQQYRLSHPAGILERHHHPQRGGEHGVWDERWGRGYGHGRRYADIRSGWPGRVVFHY